ncbi:hypothetical protein [Sphingomonas sp. CFBP 13720]|uniref:hypothetical protein n=1 Tax=Sphingomonas sp. CFBP 13720 TaxID=2775302 RepID=UPI0017856F32|nr:hypothetical protein [Sphingomonas sp. CFBP 13720]MBD8679936.1 hypothetical protein [Sphingomonas sp. CFBP 13720]
MKTAVSGHLVIRRVILSVICLLLAAPVAAQAQIVPEGDLPAPDENEVLRPRVEPARAGRVAPSTVGEAGQRQTETEGITPLSRIDSRIQNRVQSRIRNRIDRNYDPQANTVSPFAVAEERSRTVIRPRR